MKWESTTIGEQCIVTSSKRVHLSERSDEGVPFYCSKEIIQKYKGEEITECDYIREETYTEIAQKFGVPQENDLLVTTRGTIGIPYLYRNTDRFYFADGNLTWMKNFKKTMLPQYLYYWFLTHEGQKKVEAIAKGTAQKAVPIAGIKGLKISLPSIAKQRQIIGVLSAYDNFIENNQKQIKLLEEAAQRLYKEWFVDLRFPGHENTKITDGIPEGWRMAVLSEIASVNKESISKQYPYDYVDYIDIGAVSKGQINSATRLSTKDAPGRAKRIAFDGDVLWGMVRPNLKSYALVFHPKETSVFSTGFAILHAEKVPFSFLYCHVTQDEFVSYLINCTNGAAYPAVKPSHFENAVLLVPTDMVLSKFHSLVGQMFRQAEILEQKNQQAIEARDRLLPKLMSGEIEL